MLTGAFSEEKSRISSMATVLLKSFFAFEIFSLLQPGNFETIFSLTMYKFASAMST